MTRRELSQPGRVVWNFLSSTRFGARVRQGVTQAVTEDHGLYDLDALVFTGEKGAPLDRSRRGAVWRKARAAVGRDDLTFHDLRHTGNTLAAATGASTRELMARMGHSSPRAALIYQHASANRDKAIVAGLGDLMTPAPVREIRTADDAEPT